MDHGRDTGSHSGDQGGGLPNFPNLHTFPLNSPSWYTPTPQLAPPNTFVWNQSHQNSNNYNETSIPPNAFGEISSSSFGIDTSYVEDEVPIIPSLAMDRRLGVDNMFLDGGQCPTWDELENYPNIGFTNQEINPSNRIADSGLNISRHYTKRLWTPEEDSKLSELISQFGTKNWTLISEFMGGGRAGKQCRERWYNNLRPDIKSDVWTEDEERILIDAHEKIGNKWTQIAKLLPGRTENAIKNHWNAATRKKTMRLSKTNKYDPNNAKPKSTLLRDYIRGMSSSSTSAAKKSTTNSNVTIGEFNEIPSSLSNGPIPNYDEEFNFDTIENLLSTNDAQAEITTSTEPIVQALEPQLQTNMNPQGLIEESFDMHLNNNYQSATQLVSDGYQLPCPVSEPATFSNSSEPVYAYGDMNMNPAFNADQVDVWFP